MQASHALLTLRRSKPRIFSLEFGRLCELICSRLLFCAFGSSTAFYRFLHEGLVTSWLDKLYEGSNNTVMANGNLSNGKLAVLLMIFAEVTRCEKDMEPEPCCERFDERQEHLLCDRLVLLTFTSSDTYYVAARQYMQDAIGCPKLESVQALLVECFFLLSSSRANEVYSKCGTLVAMAVTLGKHMSNFHLLASVTFRCVKPEENYTDTLYTRRPKTSKEIVY